MQKTKLMQKEQYFNVFMYEKNLFGQDSVYLNVNFFGGIHSMQGWTATKMHGVQEKEAQKD